MITDVDVNLLEYEKIDALLHQCNCFHTFGGGIAYQIKLKYPELYKADIAHGRKGDHSRMGKFSFARLHDGKMGYNLYAQYNYGMGKRQTNYEAVYTGLEGIFKHAVDNQITSIGLPKNIGCRLGGGDYRIVEQIIYVVAENIPINVYICNYD
jgi:O-acetyl-ADP-ribose deacetylase (regulator of RNase III)